MRVLLVIDGMHPRDGGPPAVVAGSAIALAARGHEVTVLTTVVSEDESEVQSAWPVMLQAGVRLQFCAPQGLAGMMGRSPQADVISAQIAGADVVHVHGVWNPVAVLVGRIAYRLRVPYFISVHGVFDRRAMERIKIKLLKKRLAMFLFDFRSFLDRAAGVIFGGAAEAEQSWLPSPSMRIMYVPNGAPEGLGTIPPTKEELARLHAAAPATASWQTIILCRSRLHEEKGIDMLVDAFNLVAHEFPEAGLLIAGLRQDLAYEEQIARSIAAGPAAMRIALTTELTGASSLFLYRAADIFAMPSIAEGFSMALIEGLANARPLLITRYCHMPVVAHAGAGIVVESDVDSIAGGLRQFLAMDTAALREMGTAARRLFDENYTWDRVAALLEQHYLEAADARQAAQ